MKRSLAFLVALAACARVADRTSESEAAHTEGAPLVDAPAIMWANESYEDFQRVAADKGVTYLAADHPLVVRLQFWADALYAAAAAIQPDFAQRVPPPKVTIQKSNVQNAWVSQIPTGWAAFARAENIEQGDAGATDDAHLLVNLRSEVQRVRWMTVETTPTAEDQAALFGYLNSKFDHCRLANESGGIVFQSCLPRPAAANGAKFGYLATSRWLTLTTGRISFFHAEEENVATMAHELGHYFRAHTSTPRDQYNYFYSLDDMTPGKPKRDPRFEAETAQLRTKMLSSTSSYVDERILMKREHLGVYTTEQEADELGMEMLTRIGLAATWIQDKQLHAMQGTPAYDKCVQLRAAGWKDAAGEPAWVDEGSPADEHHDNCWRVFNADREMAIHHYPTTPTVPAPVPPGSWDEVLGASP